MEGAVNLSLEYFFPGSCYETVVEELNFRNAQCLKILCSRYLSLTVLIGALIVKVPQILKVLQAGSVKGISYISVVLELLAVTFTCTYNYAKGFSFSTWGESFFILVQVLVILVLVFYYQGQLYWVVALLPIFGVLCWYLSSDLVSLDLLIILQASVIPLLLSSRLVQIYTTFSNKSTGQLSIITSFMNCAGTASRIFTTMQETRDPIMLWMYISNFTVNGIVFLQFFIYRKSDRKKTD